MPTGDVSSTKVLREKSYDAQGYAAAFALRGGSLAGLAGHRCEVAEEYDAEIEGVDDFRESVGKHADMPCGFPEQLPLLFAVTDPEVVEPAAARALENIPPPSLGPFNSLGDLLGEFALAAHLEIDVLEDIELTEQVAGVLEAENKLPPKVRRQRFASSRPHVAPGTLGPEPGHHRVRALAERRVPVPTVIAQEAPEIVW